MATSYYTSEASLEQKWGTFNIGTWSDKDGAGSPNEVAIQYALTLADSEINSFFADGPFITPLAFMDTNSAKLAEDWANCLAARELYAQRDIADEGGKETPAGKVMARAYARTMRAMASYKGGALRLAATRRWPSPNAPAAV